MMRDYLKNNDISIKDGTDVNSIMRDMMSVILEGAFCGLSFLLAIKITSKLSNFILHQFVGLHKL